MKFDFTLHNPTKIYFGRNALDNLKTELSAYGERVLLVYGKGSVKRIGLYDAVLSILKESGKEVFELSGIKSNPTYEQMMAGVSIVRENKIDLILALGGGSVIDLSKGISASAYCEGDPWKKYWVDFLPLDNEVVPIGAILTMAGTASEMNGGSVITNEAEMIKEGRVFPPNVNPRFSILNPEYTFSVPKEQMVSGIFDVMSHLLEQYLSGDDDNVSDYIAEGVLKALLSSVRASLKNPLDYEARSNVMWCATMGLNRITGLSKRGDWNVHGIEHQVGAYTDCPHGIGLAIVSLPYYRFIRKDAEKKLARLAVNLFDADKSLSNEELSIFAIDSIEKFIDELGIPKRLRDIGATEDMLEKIAYSVCPEDSGYRKLTCEDVLAVLKECY